MNRSKWKWIHQPKLSILRSDAFIFETEPFTDIAGIENCAIIGRQVQGNFCFTCKVDYQYENPFDQCGIVLYEEHKKFVTCALEYRDQLAMRLNTTVFYGGVGDRSSIDIASGIQSIFYRIWKRSDYIRIQFSYNGIQFKDLRKFKVNASTHILGLYAASPLNSSFDCTFSQIQLENEV